MQQVLVQRLHAAVAAYAEHARSATRVARPCDKAPAPVEASPLALLNRDLLDRTEAEKAPCACAWALAMTPARRT